VSLILLPNLSLLSLTRSATAGVCDIDSTENVYIIVSTVTQPLFGLVAYDALLRLSSCQQKVGVGEEAGGGAGTTFVTSQT